MIKKIITLILIPLTIILSLASISGNVKISKTNIDNLNELSKAYNIKNLLIKKSNLKNADVYNGQYLVPNNLYDEYIKLIDDIAKDITNSSKYETLKKLNNKILNRSEKGIKVFSSSENNSKMIYNLKYHIDISNYPKSYQIFYKDYVDNKIRVLNKSTNFNVDYQKTVDLLNKLKIFIDNELNNQNNLSNIPKENNKLLDFITTQNPFKSTHPKIENKPTEKILYIDKTTGKNDVGNFIKNTKAYDMEGNDISYSIYFKQASVVDYENNGIYNIQIAAVDKYGNETIDSDIYKLVVTTKSEKLTITIPTALEIFGYGKAQTIDLRDLVIVKNYLNIRVDKEYVIVDTFKTSGEKTNLNVLPTLKDGSTDEYLETRQPGFYTLKFRSIDSDYNISETKTKEIIILPKSVDTQSGLIESSNVLPDLKKYSIEELSNYSFVKEDNYYFGGTHPLEKRISKTPNNKKEIRAKLILLDEVVSYEDSDAKKLGFHKQTYDMIQYIDTLIPISAAGNIIIPTKDIINLAHKNGVKVHGYINIPFDYLGGSVDNILQLIKMENGKYVNIEKLYQMAKDFGFDGWTINIQTGFITKQEGIENKAKDQREKYYNDLVQAKKDFEEKLYPFFKELYKYMNSRNIEVFNQGSISNDGIVYNSSIIDDSNSYFVDGNKKINDGYITHYSFYNSSKFNIDKELKKLNNYSQFDLYKGFLAPNIGNSDNGYIMLERINKLLVDQKYNEKLKTSVAIYNLNNKLFDIVENKTSYTKLDPQSPKNLVGSNDYYEYIKRVENFINGGMQISKTNMDEIQQKYETLLSQNKKEDEILKELDIFNNFSLASYFYENSTISKNSFVTHFNTGNGFYYFNEGKIVRDFTNNKTWNSDGGYNNLEDQDILPTYRWDVNILNKTDNSILIKPQFNHKKAYQKMSSLQFKSEFNSDSNSDIMLYKSDLDINQNTKAYVYLYTEETSNISLDLILEIDSKLVKIPTTQKINASSNWTKYEYNISKYGRATKIGFSISTTETSNISLDLSIGKLFISDKAQPTSVKKINSLKILKEVKLNKYGAPQLVDKIGFDRNIYANLFVEFNKIKGAYYVIYQKNNTELRYLASSYSNIIGFDGVKRFSKNLVSPTLDDYDKKAIIEVRAYDKDYNLIAKSNLSFNWPNTLIKGGKAQFRLSSNVAKPGEPIEIYPILSSATKNVEINVPGSINGAKKVGDRYEVSYSKEGFYDINYKAINDYGVNEINLKNAIIISNNVPKESDITSDASIDIRPEMKNIKYSNFCNNDEIPTYILDNDEKGNPNLSTKWCDNLKTPGQRWVIIDFKDVVEISRFVLSHSASSLSNGFDQNPDYNTVEYKISVSLDGKNWTKVVHREQNKKTITEDILENKVKAKHIKLEIINGGADVTARVYDMRIFGSR